MYDKFTDANDMTHGKNWLLLESYAFESASISNMSGVVCEALLNTYVDEATESSN